VVDEEREHTGATAEATQAGNYFVANYPPFSFWSTDQVTEVERVLAGPSAAAPPLGLYVHIPFCRKRCDFCYFKVYTDKNSKQIARYADGVLSELELFGDQPYLSGRGPEFVYFGGGTPSYLSADQLRALFDGLRARISWDDAREVAFECEPGTLQEPKIELLFELGVTRLSLGVENFDAHILEINNRAHRAKEIFRTYEFARSVGFPQINIDLIAGMVGETEDNWRACIERTLELAPDSVTLYQMEVPYNTTIYQRMKNGGTEVAPVADWDTKRRWVSEAFARLEQGGYHVGSAYTASKGADTSFLYRDSLWHGADMLGLGVSSFSHLGGVHYQNEHTFDAYLDRVEGGERPIHRALALSDDEKLVREFVLQMKLGRIDTRYFQEKFGVDVTERFAEPLREHEHAGWLTISASEIVSTRAGLMQIDRLLHDYFLPEHRGARYA
jgi:oxygen-independent coproporphyrinogen-3 oxidase